MKMLFWLAICGSVAIIAYIIRHVVKKNAEREQAEEARAAAFLAQMSSARAAPAAPTASPAAPPPPAAAPENTLELQKLLFDAARKAGDAGEPALAIQLYGRLVARFPDTGFAAPARLAVEEQKKKLMKG